MELYIKLFEVIFPVFFIIIAMGVGPEKKDVIKRTNLQDAKINYQNDIKTCLLYTSPSPRD